MSAKVFCKRCECGCGEGIIDLVESIFVNVKGSIPSLCGDAPFECVSMVGTQVTLKASGNLQVPCLNNR